MASQHDVRSVRRPSKACLATGPSTHWSFKLTLHELADRRRLERPGKAAPGRIRDIAIHRFDTPAAAVEIWPTHEARQVVDAFWPHETRLDIDTWPVFTLAYSEFHACQQAGHKMVFAVRHHGFGPSGARRGQAVSNPGRLEHCGTKRILPFQQTISAEGGLRTESACGALGAPPFQERGEIAFHCTRLRVRHAAIRTSARKRSQERSRSRCYQCVTTDFDPGRLPDRS
jgi:hypothetical protein